MRLLHAATAIVIAATALGSAAARAGTAYVLNSAAASISVIDMTSGDEKQRIPVLREPHHLVISPDGKTLVIGDSAGNELLFLDPATATLRRRVPVADPYQLGFSPDGRFLVVNGLARNQVDVYDGATTSLLHRFPLRSMPSHLAYAPDSRTVYVTLQGTDRLVAIDLSRMAVLWDQPVGRTPAGVLWHRGRLLVADMGADDVAVVDPSDGHVERRLHVGAGAHQVFLSPDGRTIWVNSRIAGLTTALDAATLATIKTYKVGGGPDDIAFAPDGHLWITRRFAESVAVLDPVSGAIRIIAAGRSPHGIYLEPPAPIAPAPKVAAR